MFKDYKNDDWYHMINESIKMDCAEWHWFMVTQIAQINLDKYKDSEKAHRDLTFEAYVDRWIEKNAQQFKAEWIINNLLNEI